MSDPDYGTRDPLTSNTDLSERTKADMAMCAKARRMHAALRQFNIDMRVAIAANQNDDTNSAERSRAMAIAALHEHPGLLQLINPENKT
jgi:hypothetical protein